MRWVVVVGCRLIAIVCFVVAYVYWIDPYKWCDGVRFLCAVRNLIVLAVPYESLRAYLLAALCVAVGMLWWFAPSWHYTNRSNQVEPVAEREPMRRRRRRTSK